MKHSYMLGTLVILCFFALPCKMIANCHPANVVMESSVVKGEPLISKIFLQLPDSLINSSYQEREMMLQRGKLYNADSDDNPEEMVAVVQDEHHLYLVDPYQEGIWEIRYWDTDDADVKMVGVHHGGSVVDLYLYFYKYDVDSKTFTYVDYPLPHLELKMFADGNPNAAVVADFYSTANRSYYPSPVVFSLMYGDGDIRAGLCEIFLEENNVSNVKTRTIQWNGKSFILASDKSGNVDDIRKSYAEAKQVLKTIDETPGDFERKDISESKNVSGIGKQTFHYDAYGKQGEPYFAAVDYNIGTETFTEEYLFSGDKLIFYYGTFRDDDLNPVELRYYFKDGHIINVIIKSKTEGGPAVTKYTGTQVPVEYFYHYNAILSRARHIVELFD